MGDMLSQAEIDALLNGTSFDQPSSGSGAEALDSQEVDALGEIGNISMGTSATTLFTLLGQKVTITTPTVTVSSWDEIASEYSTSYVGVKVEYTNGLIGSNLMILKELDVKIITDLMMGGDGANTDGNLSELHLSAISEAMNQMVGSSSTSMSSMFDKRIDISPPKAFIFDMNNIRQNINIDEGEKVVKIAFKMVIGTLIDSEIMQILPLPFAKKMVENLLNMDTGSGTFELPKEVTQPSQPAKPQRQAAPPPQQPQAAPPVYSQPQPHPQAPGYQTEYIYEQPPEPRQVREPVNVQPAHFQNFDENRIVLDRKNISLIMDVPLQVTVELGRTERLIKDILEFSPGSIIELDKLAGEPVDILVNGKAIAKGEVVVIDESFGVRITDIIHPSKRL
ncbi:MAG TPA: flagellar motor switch phosphatase FliY [Clostridia bacterium]|nr:flagellar motor switch phosphatase FliY [Clostridia bacterium]